MHDSRVDFTGFFRGLGKLSTDSTITQISLRNHFIDRAGIDQWFTDYFSRLKDESSNDASRQKAMSLVNPKYVLRNHLAQFAIELAQKNDFSEVNKLLTILSKPFDEQQEYESYAAAPPPNLQSIEVSCSS